MATHKKTDNQTIVKAYVMKAKMSKHDIERVWKPTIDEYIEYYNKLSDWICKNLTSVTIGDLLKYVGEKQINKGVGYYTYFIDEQKTDLPLYTLFTDCPKTHADNLLFEAVRKINPENYIGNLLSLFETGYRRNGYFDNVISNYRTKMTTLKINPKYKRFSSENMPTDEVLLEQTIYEVTKNDFKNDDDWKKSIDYMKQKSEPNTALIFRMETLFDYWKDHKQDVEQYINQKRVECLKDFGGCKRRADGLSMVIFLNKKLTKIEADGLTSYKLTTNLFGGKYTINIFGHRALVSVCNGERVENENIDICNKHGERFTFKIENGNLFVALTADYNYEKQPNLPKHIVGVDTNIKHSMLNSSIEDKGKVKGYVNLYKEFLSDENFKKTITSVKERKQYEELSKYATFGITELDSLFARATDTEKNILCKRELAMQDVFEKLEKRYKDDHKIKFYLGSTQKLRAQYISYFKIKEAYNRKQQEYDLAHGKTDNPDEVYKSDFINEPSAKEMLVKLNRIERKIIGCRNNIVTYAFSVIKDNGYDTIGVEYLTSSQFEKKRRLPSIKSLLNYHKLLGKPKDEWNLKEWNDVYVCYRPELDDAGNIMNFTITNEGIKRNKESTFYNSFIKAIHFADVKDKFAQLTNNNTMNTVFIPSSFTSQIDSKTQKLYLLEYTEKCDNGKTKKVVKFINKRVLRKIQEQHLNGMNADNNAARNIRDITKNLLDVFTKKQADKNCYNSAEFMIQTKFKKRLSQATVFGELNRNGYVKVLTKEEYDELTKSAK